MNIMSQVLVGPGAKELSAIRAILPRILHIMQLFHTIQISQRREGIDGEQHLEYWKLDFILQVLLPVAQLCEAYTLQSSNIYRRVAGQMQSILATLKMKKIKAVCEV